MTLAELAERLGATLVPAPGADASAAAAVAITGVAGLEQAGPSHLSFLTNIRYTPLARTTRAAALLVEPSSPELPIPTLRIANPYLAFARALEIFHPRRSFPPGVHSTAVVSPTASIGARSHIGAYVVIGDDVRIGDDAVLLPHTVIYPGAVIGSRFFAHAHAVVREDCRLGDDVTLQNGAVIGADGFGFAKDPEGRWSKILQTGPAVLEDEVEVQANACIDRASVGETRIARGAKIDNLVQVGHGSSVGENSLLCAQVGLAGSTTVGKNVILAGQVGVAGHLTIGDGAIATAQTGIPSDVAPGAVVSGYPAMDNKAWLRTVAAVNRLPELIRRMRSHDK
ncbi:MAG TPA: UDP-3-O-(3-hydroxymyristoyl)glucosamine N-acyltransferase [Acidobacteriaceae bacterium]|nr:UDP-3-O-(3-hydroxymyristoyl)glucosamine N-acyltransferase [Acidobacteriaceae bacterium]